MVIVISDEMINILSLLFRFCVEVLKAIPPTHMREIKRSKVEITKKLIWTDEQIRAFLAWDVVRNSHYYPMLCISFFCSATRRGMVGSPI
jgi:hypothetical protein